MMVHILQQQWPQDFDCSGKRVVIIGSGATAVTLGPVLSKTAASVTVLQRSPTYIVPAPSEDRLASCLRRCCCPGTIRLPIVRARFALQQMILWRFAKRQPGLIKGIFFSLAKKVLGQDAWKANKQHLRPAYAPWDQRICVCPDGDFFKEIKAGRLQMVTDTIAAINVRMSAGLSLPHAHIPCLARC
jgi:monooxygenase